VEEIPAGTEPDDTRTAPIAGVRRLHPVDDDQDDPPEFWEDVAEYSDGGPVAHPSRWRRPALGDLGDRVEHFAGELLEADDGTGLPRRVVWWAAAGAAVALALALVAVLVPAVRLVWTELWP